MPNTESSTSTFPMVVETTYDYAHTCYLSQKAIKAGEKFWRVELANWQKYNVSKQVSNNKSHVGRLVQKTFG